MNLIGMWYFNISEIANTMCWFCFIPRWSAKLLPQIGVHGTSKIGSLRLLSYFKLRRSATMNLSLISFNLKILSHNCLSLSNVAFPISCLGCEHSHVPSRWHLHRFYLYSVYTSTLWCMSPMMLRLSSIVNRVLFCYWSLVYFRRMGSFFIQSYLVKFVFDAILRINIDAVLRSTNDTIWNNLGCSAANL